MPLCSIELPQSFQSSFSDTTRVCGVIHEHLRDVLGIPEFDHEDRISVTDNLTSPKLIIEFTEGPNEYPDETIHSFFPTVDQIHQAGLAIHQYAKEELGISETTIKSWFNTTFLIRDPNASPVNTGTSTTNVGQYLEQPKIRLVLSPVINNQPASLSRKESEPVMETDPNLKIATEITHLIAETLAIPDGIAINTEIIYPKVADCDLTVEFDCLPQSDHQMSEETRLLVAHRLEQLLNNTPQTKTCSAEIWIRQGEPQVQKFD